MKTNIRNSVKIIILNDNNEMLLLFTDDSSIKTADGKYQGGFYQLIGGKIEEEETLLEAAKRELFEETGLTSEDVTFGEVVWYGQLDLNIHGKMTHIKQRFILARTHSCEVTLKNLTKEEKGVCKKLCWMSLEDIKNSDTTIYPKRLPVYLKDILDGNIPNEPIFIDLS